MSKSNIYLLKFIVLQSFLIGLIPAMQIGHLSDLKWEKRIIIIVDDENFEFNKRAKQYQKELEERDLSIVFYNKGIAYLDNKIISDRFSKSVEKKIKNRKPRYSLILVGKDGGVKKTYLYETKLRVIFYDIDKMPMRKSEMRKSYKN